MRSHALYASQARTRHPQRKLHAQLVIPTRKTAVQPVPVLAKQVIFLQAAMERHVRYARSAQLRVQAMKMLV